MLQVLPSERESSPPKLLCPTSEGGIVSPSSHHLRLRRSSPTQKAAFLLPPSVIRRPRLVKKASMHRSTSNHRRHWHAIAAIRRRPPWADLIYRTTPVLEPILPLTIFLTMLKRAAALHSEEKN
ncbi:UNVERIFIED_CONTAM: hypothetical protein Slati_1214200 [Sesamum latifolium]|uniref:Uncharacterized protein n=1 Tax=Sesamum latifolium TaxID=2727402 RepID=A0AAW2XF46_9LAMI